MFLPYIVVVDGKPQRQILSPLLYQEGRCYCHSIMFMFMADVEPHIGMLKQLKMADVIAKWQMEWPLQGGWLVDVITRLADGIAMGQLFYFNLSSEMFNRTSSQMGGRWYLPMFLFSGGLLILIYRASLIVLIRFWSSLPTMLKLSRLILWPVVL